MVIDWITVDSSVFEAVAYLGEERLLYLKFHGGRVWQYLDFPAHQYDEFLASESLGRYFGKHTRGKFPEEEVQDAACIAS
jgi:KTSC domain